MPRRYTMGTLVESWKQLADLKNDDSIADAVWKSFGNMVYGELWPEVSLGAADRYFEASTTITANGSTSYTEPTNHFGTVRIARVDADGREWPLDELRPQDEVHARGLTSGDAVYYALIDDQLFLFPNPSSGSYKWYYTQQPTDLSSFADADVVDVISPAGEQFLAWGVVALALHRQQKDSSFALMQKEGARTRVQFEASHRNAYEPRTRGAVVDDDDGFSPKGWE